jgi:hypothetical protein
MKKIVVSLVGVLLLSPAAPAYIPRYAEAPLSRRDIEEVQRVGCWKPFKVKATSIRGTRDTFQKRGPLFADVRCAPHLRNDQYTAHYQRFCTKERGRWTCGDPVPRLASGFRGMDQIDIPLLDGLTIEAGFASLQCLARGLDRQEILDFRQAGRPTWLRLTKDSASGSTVVEASLESGMNCGLIHVPLACDANGGAPLRLADQGCVLVE